MEPENKFLLCMWTDKHHIREVVLVKKLNNKTFVVCDFFGIVDKEGNLVSDHSVSYEIELGNNSHLFDTKEECKERAREIYQERLDSYTREYEKYTKKINGFMEELEE